MFLVSRAPRPALSDHPEFAVMLALTLQRYHCTLAEIREDYWLGRAWRALAGDPELQGRVARVGVCNVLLMGDAFSEAPTVLRDRAALRRHALARLSADTAHTADRLGIRIEFADQPVVVAEGCVRSLLAQTVAGDSRWMDLSLYRDDLTPVVVPVAMSAGAIVAA